MSAIYLINRMVCNLNTVGKKVRKTRIRGWKEEFQHVQKPRTYQLVNSDFQTEIYVVLNIPKISSIYI
jgi:hypothetical protein